MIMGAGHSSHTPVLYAKESNTIQEVVCSLTQTKRCRSGLSDVGNTLEPAYIVIVQQVVFDCVTTMAAVLIHTKHVRSILNREC